MKIEMERIICCGPLATAKFRQGQPLDVFLFPREHQKSSATCPACQVIARGTRPRYGRPRGLWEEARDTSPHPSPSHLQLCSLLPQSSIGPIPRLFVHPHLLSHHLLPLSPFPLFLFSFFFFFFP